MTRTVSPSPELVERLRDLASFNRKHYPTTAEPEFYAVGDEAADALESTQAEIARLTTALNALQQAEATYRYAHDVLGAGDTKTGRAWDLLKRAGDNARAALKDSPNVG